jgi:hypothetical protein
MDGWMWWDGSDDHPCIPFGWLEGGQTGREKTGGVRTPAEGFGCKSRDGFLYSTAIVRALQKRGCRLLICTLPDLQFIPQWCSSSSSTLYNSD